MKAHVDCNPQLGESLLFEPKHSTFHDIGLNVQESLLTVNDDGMTLVPLENFQGVPVRLEEGVQLNVAKQYLCSREIELKSAEESQCAIVKSLANTPERCQRLIPLLNLPDRWLS